LGYFISCYFEDAMTAGMAPTFMLLPSVIFGGFIVNLSTLHSWISWIQYLSPTRYGFEALLWA